MAKRDIDITIWGASGFTGRLVCEHIATHYQGTLKWAIAGRNRSKFDGLRNDLAQKDKVLKDVPILIGDVSDSSSLLQIAKTTAVLLNTAGPYRLSGSPIVQACIEAKTHYADITGEVAWMKETTSRYHADAAAAGVKIVHCCGWDCIPADLGALLVAQYAQDKLGRKMESMVHIITELAGAFSGGSLNTALEFYAHPLEALFPHPYSLNPPQSRHGKDGQQYLGVGYEPISGLFTSPSIFAPANLRIVRRSNALLGNLYGQELRFNDVRGHKSFFRALLETISVLFWGVVLLVAARIHFVGRCLKAASPKPGEGPSEAFMKEGRWKCLVVGRTCELHGAAPQHIIAALEGMGDPGYSQTSRMLLEAGICLLEGRASDFCLQGGVLTPASALGMPLIERLQRTGMMFEVLQDGWEAGKKLG